MSWMRNKNESDASTTPMGAPTPVESAPIPSAQKSTSSPARHESRSSQPATVGSSVRIKGEQILLKSTDILNAAQEEKLIPGNGFRLTIRGNMSDTSQTGQSQPVKGCHVKPQVKAVFDKVVQRILDPLGKINGQGGKDPFSGPDKGVL